METSNQNPAQYEWGPFPFGDGERIMDIRYDQVFKAVFTRDSEISRAALSDLISTLIGRTVEVKTIVANEPATGFLGVGHFAPNKSFTVSESIPLLQTDNNKSHYILPTLFCAVGQAACRKKISAGSLP